MLRIEVSDARGKRRPPDPGMGPGAPPLAEAGRGLLLVQVVAARWEVRDRVPVGKTVIAEPALPR
ncbi:ATP-binding protein [Streptomyces sp. NPDC020858]|uniref:ATP-binding protein n=1 Tax=Streptomyces sp. NPDC020858 TaxID=3365097 RepID=UPI003789B360